jgi:hypothetical protein
MAAQLRDDSRSAVRLRAARRVEHRRCVTNTSTPRKVAAFLEQRPRDKHVCITGRDRTGALAGDRTISSRGELAEASVPGPGYKAQRGVEF